MTLFAIQARISCGEYDRRVDWNISTHHPPQQVRQRVVSSPAPSWELKRPLEPPAWLPAKPKWRSAAHAGKPKYQTQSCNQSPPLETEHSPILLWLLSFLQLSTYKASHTIAMAPSAPHTESPSLIGIYTSPTTTQTFTHPLPSLPQKHTTADKTAYLSTLRTQTTALQAQINTLLTAKMEEDKAAASTTAPSQNGKKSVRIDDEKEEENYGEEVVEED
jgi:hypothetical protein